MAKFKMESEERKIVMVSWHTGKEYVLVKPRTEVEFEVEEQEVAEILNPNRER